MSSYSQYADDLKPRFIKKQENSSSASSYSQYADDCNDNHYLNKKNHNDYESDKQEQREGGTAYRYSKGQ